MTDEKTIYISPEDDVTTVRERLEKTTSRQVTLIIPAQTQLRSLTSWRLLHADARRMSKDILIISTDPQIRSLAQAGKFRVAHSQATSVSGKSRPPSRPSRAGGVGRGKPSSPMRAASTRRTADERGNTYTNEGRRAEDAAGSKEMPSRQSDHLNQWYGPVPEQRSTQRNTDYARDEATTGELSDTFSSFDGQIYGLPSDVSPPIHPLSQPPIEEDTTYLAEDYKQAQDILQSASQRQDQGENTATPPPLTPPQAPETPRSDEREYENEDNDPTAQRITPFPTESADVYQETEEHIPRSSLTEQHGSAIVDGLDTREHPIQEVTHEPTSVGYDEIEDLGDLGGDISGSPDMPTTHAWDEPMPDEGQLDSAGPPLHYKSNTQRSNRRENVPPPPPQQEIDDPNYLPPPTMPIEDRPTVVITPQDRAQAAQERPAASMREGTRASGSLSAETGSTGTKPTGKRASQQTLGGTRPPATARPGTARQRTQVPPRAAANVGAQRTAAGRGSPTKKLPPPSRRRSGMLFLAIAALLLFILGLLAFFVPSADVTIALPSKNYAHAVTLKAVPKGQQSTGANVVPADSITQDFFATSVGKATGSSKVGTVPATGNVTFTNNGSALVTIPNGTVITTSNGSAFATQAEAVVDVSGSNVGNTIQVPVQAQQAGDSGNVGAGTVTVIPPSSLNAIAQYDHMNASDLKLAVVNQQGFTGGGTGNAPAVSAQDIDAVKSLIRSDLSKQYNTWLRQSISAGDIAGQLTNVETVAEAPAVGQVVSGDGTFTEKLKLTVTVLVARSAALQHATIAQLDTFLKQDKRYPGYAVVSDTKIPVGIERLKESSDGKVVTLAFNAAGKIVPDISVQKVQSLIDGRSVRDARDILLKGGIPDVRSVDIKTYPQIGSWSPNWIAFWTAHINVHLVPDTTPPTPPKK